MPENYVSGPLSGCSVETLKVHFVLVPVPVPVAYVNWCDKRKKKNSSTCKLNGMFKLIRVNKRFEYTVVQAISTSVSASVYILCECIMIAKVMSVADICTHARISGHKFNRFCQCFDNVRAKLRLFLYLSASLSL